MNPPMNDPFDEAAKLLSYKDYSEAELRFKLSERGFSEEEGEGALSELRRLGYLNDGALAQTLCESYAARGYGARRISFELRRRDLEDDIIGEALSDLPDPADTLDNLIARRHRGPADYKTRRKLGDMLFRRGFDWDDIGEALARIPEEEES